MKLVLHIGSGKTGTTSIQNFFVRNADKLKEVGVLYPVNKSVAPNHILLPAGFVKHDSISIPHNRFYLDDFDKYKNDSIRFMHALDSDIRKTSPKVLVMSAEQLFRDFSEVSAIDFSEFLAPYFDEIIVVAYVRDPVSDYTSRISQKMRTGGLVFSPVVRNVRSVLEYYESQFPGCVRVNAFERDQLTDGDVIRDFVSKYVPEALGLLNTNKPSIYNESLPQELLFCLQQARIQYQPVGIRPEIKTSAFISVMTKNYMKTHAAEKSSRLKLKPEVEAYLQASADDYFWLKNKYGVTFKNLDYESIKLPQETLGNCTGLSDIVLMNESSLAVLDSIIPSNSAISCFLRTKRYILFCQVMRLYRIFVARSWLGKLKRKLYN